jgi:hypothetical protein
VLSSRFTSWDDRLGCPIQANQPLPERFWRAVDKFSFGSKIIDETLIVDQKNSMIGYSPGADHNAWHGGIARRHGRLRGPL